MALPKLNTQKFELMIPSTDKKVKYRPFLVKEEKILLQALESGENKQIVQALKDIVKECTFGQLDGNVNSKVFVSNTGNAIILSPYY